MNYAEMSDFEINKAVAEAQGYDTKLIQFFGLQGLSKVRTTEIFFDYCNSWADAGPIISANKISVEFYDCGLSLAFSLNNMEYNQEDNNPLRAAMIVFLMMQESK